ncbi:hypothetical protein [Thioclava sp. F1Mire-8]|uniref:hypothetical protein n=1 Tax=Thioclava sp. F1Mire-8 TaxID=1973006 RepID=UPI001F0A8164|nr:hypothetical protein [Thioclava sp. F1Mire-8]
MQHYLVDQAAQDGRRLAAAITVIERYRQIFHLAAVDLGKRRVDDDGIGRWHRGELVPEFGLLGLQRVHSFLHARVEHTGGDRIHEIGDLAVNLCEALF